MAIDLKPLLERAFYKEQPVKNATLSIEKAADDFARRTNTGGTNLDVVAPANPDEEWLERMVLQPLVYFCESSGRPIPRCGGVFLSLFVGDALYCIAAGDVISVASRQLGRSIDELRVRYGTHETGAAPR